MHDVISQHLLSNSSEFMVLLYLYKSAAELCSISINASWHTFYVSLVFRFCDEVAVHCLRQHLNTHRCGKVQVS